MEEVLNDVESCKMSSEDVKALLEKNKKRTLKTHAQVQALEKFYNEHKYPTESMKMQLAESIGLTEKQVSGWFCHRRLKDKRLMNGDNYVIGRQDRSSGVIQDHGSGHRQDSCGSTKQGDDRIFETREVESSRLTRQECSAVELTYDHGGQSSGKHNYMDDTFSGSSSSLRNMSSDHNVSPFDVTNSRYLIPKFPMDATGVKSRCGPSGYLKVKGQVENTAITAVKRQLGKQYREDGPPLGVEFDPLPPGAFESSMQNPVDKTYYTGEAGLPASSDFSKICQHPEFGKGSEYSCSKAFRNSNMDRTSFKAPQWSDFPDNCIQQKFKQNTSHGACYQPWRNSSTSTEMPQISARDISGSESRDDYRMRYRQGFEDIRMNSVSSSCLLQPFDVNSRRDVEPSFHKYNNTCRKSSKGEYDSSNLTGSAYHNSFDKVRLREIAKDEKAYAERIPYKNDKTSPKRMRDGVSWQLHMKKSTLVDYQRGSYQVTRSAAAEMPCSYTEDDGSAQTSCSVE